MVYAHIYGLGRRPATPPSAPMLVAWLYTTIGQDLNAPGFTAYMPIQPIQSIYNYIAAHTVPS